MKRPPLFPTAHTYPPDNVRSWELTNAPVTGFFAIYDLMVKRYYLRQGIMPYREYQRRRNSYPMKPYTFLWPPERHPEPTTYEEAVADQLAESRAAYNIMRIFW